MTGHTLAQEWITWRGEEEDGDSAKLLFMEAVVSCASLKCGLVQNLGKSKEENRLFKYTEKGCNLFCSQMVMLRSNYSS